MNNFSEKSIRQNCPHCDLNSFAYQAVLERTDLFSIICDVHPLEEGHVLIIPKSHISCIGEYKMDLFNEFAFLYEMVKKFIKETYGMVSSFEHGKIGQTVFHSHIHLLPYQGAVDNIIPEGKKHLIRLYELSELKDAFKNEGQYLYLSIGEKMWIVDLKLGAPRFFRDRFAMAIGKPERGNWKEMKKNKAVMGAAKQEIKNLQKKWMKFARCYNNADEKKAD